MFFFLFCFYKIKINTGLNKGKKVSLAQNFRVFYCKPLKRYKTRYHPQTYLTIIIVLKDWVSTEYTLGNAEMETSPSFSAEVQRIAQRLSMHGSD